MLERTYNKFDHSGVRRAIQECDDNELRVLLHLAQKASGSKHTITHYGRKVTLEIGMVPPARIANLSKDLKFNTTHSMNQNSIAKILKRLDKKRFIDYQTFKIGRKKGYTLVTVGLIHDSTLKNNRVTIKKLSYEESMLESINNDSQESMKPLTNKAVMTTQESINNASQESISSPTPIRRVKEGSEQKDSDTPTNCSKEDIVEVSKTNSTLSPLASGRIVSEKVSQVSNTNPIVDSTNFITNLLIGHRYCKDKVNTDFKTNSIDKIGNEIFVYRTWIPQPIDDHLGYVDNELVEKRKERLKKSNNQPYCFLG